jgi:16S rRNA (adenine1518-N6/adenine1519-N6)-dimethyltransferase
MPELSDVYVVKEILSRHGFRFSKSLGQNFIINPELCPRIAEEGGARKGVCALEVGPGIGVLTKELALRADKVLAVEIDSALPPVLAETLAEFDNVTVLNADVMKLNLPETVKENFGEEPFVICANLPYYITSPVLMNLLESGIKAESITVMVQKEAADRITAKPGTKECGAISAAIWYYSEAEKLFDVKKGNFMPAPKVDSAVIRLKIREKPAVETSDEKFFFRVIKAAFCQRRKTLLNSLSAGLSLTKVEISKALTECGLLQTARAEELSLESFAALSDALNK